MKEKGAHLSVLFEMIDWVASASEASGLNDLRFFEIHASTPNQFHVLVNQSTKISSAKYNFYFIYLPFLFFLTI